MCDTSACSGELYLCTAVDPQQASWNTGTPRKHHLMSLEFQREQTRRDECNGMQEEREDRRIFDWITKPTISMV